MTGLILLNFERYQLAIIAVLCGPAQAVNDAGQRIPDR